MKKLLVILSAMALSIGAFAQKGESAVGINLNASPCLEKGASLTNYGVAAKYRYGITDALRGEAVVGYDFKAKGFGFFEAGINVDYLFDLSSKFAVYPLVGLGYANIQGGYDDDDDYGYYRSYGYDDDDDDSTSLSRFYFNVGIGAEYMVTNHIAVNLEVKYQYIQNFSRLPISLGIAYKF